MLQLLSAYKDVIVLSFEDIKTYDPNIIVHDIPLKFDAKIFHQRQRPIDLVIEPLVMKEVQKLLDAKITFPIYHYKLIFLVSIDQSIYNGKYVPIRIELINI